MIIDFLKQPDLSPIHADVCVIGAGAAGITLTRALMIFGHQVALLESGGLDQNPGIDDFMKGENTGFSYYPLHESRLRFFGGTTSIWGGRCAQLDEIDFEKRSWIPYSGWPISKKELDPYYKCAQKLFEIEPVPGGNALWDLHGLKPPDFDPDVIDTAFWQFDTKSDRFAASRAKDLLHADNVTVLLHANATNLQAHQDGQRVDAVQFANLAGHSGEVRAQLVVVAAGGIENPRILLASNDVQKNGLGNDQDLVGRFFMEHPHARGGRIHCRRPSDVLRLLPRAYSRNSKRYAALARPADTLQKQQGLLNTSFTISVRQHPDDELVMTKKILMRLKHDLRPSKTNRLAWHAFRKFLLGSREYLGTTIADISARRRGYGVYTVIRAEQSPNPDSRVILSSERDALGVPRGCLHWAFQDIDKHSVVGTMRALDDELRRLNLGTLELDNWLHDKSVSWKIDSLISNHPIGGYHHMGTTRMASSSKHGVVDGNAKVFGLDNLYIAGSSIFPTSGWANPTLTIVALTLKLADHLDIRLSV